MEGKKEPRISNASAALMIVTALVCDLTGPFGAVGGPVVFFLWFKFKKVPIIGPKQLGKQIANLGLNALGEIFTAGVWVGVTVGVIITIVLSRIEDRLGVSLDFKTLAHPQQAAEKIKSGLSSPGGAPDAAPQPPEQSPPERPQMNDIKGAPESRTNVIGGADRFQKPSPAPVANRAPSPGATIPKTSIPARRAS